MSPLLDQLLVWLAIGAALGYFAVRAVRNRKACGGGCCTGKTAITPPLRPAAPEKTPATSPRTPPAAPRG